MRGITLSVALVVMTAGSTAEAGLFGLFNKCGGGGCCDTGCCEEPTCCAPSSLLRVYMLCSSSLL